MTNDRYTVFEVSSFILGILLGATGVMAFAGTVVPKAAFAVAAAWVGVRAVRARQTGGIRWLHRRPAEEFPEAWQGTGQD
ncbi:MAG: hypothetical protein ABEI39_03970 [Halobacteriales archaeon]